MKPSREEEHKTKLQLQRKVAPNTGMAARVVSHQPKNKRELAFCLEVPQICFILEKLFGVFLCFVKNKQTNKQEKLNILGIFGKKDFFKELKQT